jgi:EAL domain-containing protein (putative c-di-GMP-specific phosphodiesterase class I)
VDYLKIDGSFIRELTRSRVDQTMVRMIGEVAKAAGLETVAEYVESAPALQLLAKYGIDYAQGHYIGRAAPEPLPLEVVFDAWSARNAGYIERVGIPHTRDIRRAVNVTIIDEDPKRAI